jgi:hypothetical protein
VFGNQFIREADGLIQINLDSNSALINLKLTEGALQDTDTANDVIAANAVITSGRCKRLLAMTVGTLANPIHTLS